MDAKNRKPLEFQILVTGKNGYWGLDDNIEDAKARCKRGGGKAPYIVCILPKGADIDGLNISYAPDSQFVITKLGVI